MDKFIVKGERRHYVPESYEYGVWYNYVTPFDWLYFKIEKESDSIGIYEYIEDKSPQYTVKKEDFAKEVLWWAKSTPDPVKEKKVVTNKVKVVLNTKYGGFNLSQDALIRLRDKGWTVSQFKEDHTPIDINADLLLKPTGTSYGKMLEGELAINNWKHRTYDERFRSREDIVGLVQELGPLASGEDARLVIAEIDDDYNWEIKSFDGIETIHYLSLKEEDDDLDSPV